MGEEVSFSDLVSAMLEKFGKQRQLASQMSITGCFCVV